MTFVEFPVLVDGTRETLAIQKNDVDKFISCGEQETIIKLYSFTRRGRLRKKKKTITVDEPFSVVLAKLNEKSSWQ